MKPQKTAVLKMAECLLFLIVASSLLWSQKVKVGYDKSVDFGQYKTYAWAKREVPDRMPLVVTLFKAAVDQELSGKGLQKTDSDPDLLISYQGSIDAKNSVAAHDPGYTTSGGVPPPDATMWGGSISAASAQTEVQGALAIDMVDARHKRLVWRGTAKAKIDPQRQSKIPDQVNKAISEMFKKFPPKD
jgi:hypothetical protein